MPTHDLICSKASHPSMRTAFSTMLIFCSIFLLTSCIAGMQGGAFSTQPGGAYSSQPGGEPPTQSGEVRSSLPKVEISQPAKFTKGAPAYTMLFHTTSSSMPMGGGDYRIVTMRAVSHPGPADKALPKAYHMIPPAMKMDEYLPLLPPDRQTAQAGGPGTASQEPQRLIIKTYWGCGENVRPGQPRVFDTSKGLQGGAMSAFMGGMTGGRSGGRYIGGGDLKSGWVEALWPNREDNRQVPAAASLVGAHFLHGNFLPHMRFNMDARHDIMEKLTLNAEKDSLKEAIPIAWKKLPTAIGYHLMAVAFSDARKEMIIWTSSENPDINVSGQFLDTPVVKKHVAGKVILPAERDRCIIPKGIFDGMDVATVSGTAWGDDYWASEPPRPANAPKDWKPDWVVKGQFLSTSNLMLGMPGGNVPDPGNSTSGPASSGANPSNPGAPSVVNVLRGLF